MSATSALLTLIGSAHAGVERLSLPFTCQVSDKGVQLSPSGEQFLKVIGLRQERVVLACAEGRPVQCRTMIAHRFDIMCGDSPVGWDRVAEAIGGRRASRVWREGAQLNIALLERVSTTAPATAMAPCSTKPLQSRAGDDAAHLEQIALKPCRAPQARELRFVMPAGFAPVAHFGARIVEETTAVSSAGSASPRPGREAVVAAAESRDSSAPAAQQRLLERTILSEPLPELGAGAPSDRKRTDSNQSPQSKTPLLMRRDDVRALDDASRAVAGTAGGEEVRADRADDVDRLKATSKDAAASSLTRSAWLTTVIPSQATGSTTPHAAIASVAPAPSSYHDTILWLVLTSVFVMTGWAMWRRKEHLAVLAGRTSGRVLDWLATPDLGEDVLSGVLRRLSSALRYRPGVVQSSSQSSGFFPADGLDATYEGVAGIVEALPHDLPLRRVLDDEIRRIRQRLCVAKTSGASVAGEVPAPAYRVLMRDLERIRRIGISARDSVMDGSSAASAFRSGRMPKTREEAFSLLGLNPYVNEATIKKCVDALRMSWHPDLAHDRADRAIREERIKQINAAVELISVRPQLA